MTASQGSTREDIDLPKEESGQEQNEDLGSPARGRRTLLKGVAAIPVIMTLPSGAAAAMSSSQACVARDQQLAADAQPSWITGGKDTWVRKAVTARTIVRNGNGLSNLNSFQAVARDKYGTIQTNGNGGSNESLVVYQLDPNEDVWLDRKGREGGYYYTVQSGIQGESQGESALDQTGSQTGTTQTTSNRTFIERRQTLERSSSMQVWTGGWWKETGVSAAEAGSGKQEDNSPHDDTNRPIREMEDSLGNTYSIVTGDTTQYIIAQVDEQGRVMGFGFTSQFNHITGSCWSSINPLTDMI